MKNIVAAIAILCGLSSTVSAQPVRSGSVVMDVAEIESLRGSGAVPIPVTGGENVLENPGFEAGTLPPWTTNNWTVTSQDANSGSFSAEDIGNFFIRQDFAPIDVEDVKSVTLFMRQPEEEISQISFFYEGGGSDPFLVFPTAGWSQIDITAQLRASGQLTGIQIFGYEGGGPDPDLTRIDDVVIESVTIPVELIEFGVE